MLEFLLIKLLKYSERSCLPDGIAKRHYYHHLSLVIESACDCLKCSTALDCMSGTVEIMPTLVLERASALLSEYTKVKRAIACSGCSGGTHLPSTDRSTEDAHNCLLRTHWIRKPLAPGTICTGSFKHRFSICWKLWREFCSYRTLWGNGSHSSFDPDHIYMRRVWKYADILFLKGRFDESLDRVQKLQAKTHCVWAIRLNCWESRDIFTFSGGHKAAELIYRSALKLAERMICEHIAESCTQIWSKLCARLRRKKPLLV